MNDHALSYKGVLAFSWEKFKKYWKVLLAGMLVLFGIELIIGFVGEGLMEISSFLASVFNVIVWVGSLILNMVLLLYMLRLVDDQGSNDVKAELMAAKDIALAKLPLLVRYVLASLLYSLLVVLGLVLLIIPGIYWGIKYQFVLMLILDKNMSIGEAFKQSGEMTQGRKLWLFGLGLVFIVLIIAGALALLVGLLAAIPVMMIASAYVYRRLSGSMSRPTSSENLVV